MEGQKTITELQINEIVKRIVENYHPDKIILFGSYANGNPTKDSDIDLLVVKDDNTPKLERNRQVRKYIRDMIIPVDIIVKTNKEFNDLKDVIGTIVYPAVKYGKLMYESAG